MNTELQIKELYNHFLESSGVSTDTRMVESGQLYFALKGDRFDGNAFAQKALESGAKLAVVDDPIYRAKSGYFLVDDVLKTLQELSSFVRDQWNFPVIAITGSNGKTTTKELLRNVLGKKYSVFSTPGNFNNHIGLPLTLLMTPRDTNMLVLELGANHLGEHAFLCQIAKPDFGIVTNNGKDHLEGYGSFENVIKSNSELFEYLKSVDGTAFVNSDDKIILDESRELNTIKYSFRKESDYKCKSLKSGVYASISLPGGTRIDSMLAGNFNSINLCAAACIADHFKITEKQIKEAIESYQPALNRSQIVEFHGMNVILDAYNANPSSMKLSLTTLKSVKSPKMAILGGMRELGEFELQEHRDLMSYIEALALDKTWLIGKEFFHFRDRAGIKWFETTEECRREFHLLDFKDAHVLIKGSRKYELEKLIQ